MPMSAWPTSWPPSMLQPTQAGALARWPLPIGPTPAQVVAWPLIVGDVRRYDLGTIEGVGLSVTDALYLPDGRLVLSAAAEDSGNNIDDGFVTGAALALFDGAQRLAMAMLRTVAGRVAKLEGIALLETLADGCRLLGVVDDDDPTQASLQLVLRLRLD